MDDNLPNPKTVDTDTPKADVGFDIEKQVEDKLTTSVSPTQASSSRPQPQQPQQPAVSPTSLDPMTPPDEVQIDPVPLPSVTALPEHPVPPASPNPPAGGEGGPLPPDMEHPVPPASPKSDEGGPASPNPPAGGEGGPKPPVPFAEEPTIKPPSSAPVHSPQEKKGKTGGGKKVIAGIAALVLLVAALAGGIYLVGVPGSGELRRKAGNTTDINATMTVTATNLQACGGGATYWVARYTCDDVKTSGQPCNSNENIIDRNVTAGESFGFDLSRQCGTQQIDLSCSDGRDYVEFLSYYGSVACGAAASPTPSPAPRWCGNCDTFSCALRPLSECYNASNNNYGDSNPEDGVCDGTCNLPTPTPVPTSTPGPSPTPGAAQCIDVRSQIQSGGTWVDNDLSLARIGDNIRFVARVSATAAGVSFQITSGTGVPQTVAGTLLSTTATTKEYAAEYTIPASGQLSVAATVQ